MQILVANVPMRGHRMMTRVYAEDYHLEEMLERVWIASNVNLLSVRLIGFYCALQVHSLLATCSLQRYPLCRNKGV